MHETLECSGLCRDLEYTQMTFKFTLAALAVTGTLTTQLPLVAMPPPVNVITAPPAVALRAPPQLLNGAGLAAISRPEGSVSENATPVSASGLGLVMVSPTDATVLTCTVVGEKDFAIVAGTVAIICAEAVAVFAPALAAVMAPAVMTLVNVPPAVAMTWLVMVQLLDAASEPPDKLSKVPPAAAATEPPQVLEVVAGVALTRLAG